MNNQISAICVANTQIREINGLYSLADLHKASGGAEKHKPAFWLRNKQTIELIEKMTALQICTVEQNQALSTQAKQALLDDENSLRENVIKVVNGGKHGSGTYVCKELVVHYGMWISPEFSIKVIQTFLHSQQKASEPVQPALPHNPYAISSDVMPTLANLPLASYLVKLQGFYGKAYGIPTASVGKMLGDKFGWGDAFHRASIHSVARAVAWLHQELDKAPRVDFGVSRSDLLNIFKRQCQYKCDFENWNEWQLQCWLNETFFCNQQKLATGYPRSLDDASYSQLEMLVQDMKRYLTANFQLLASSTTTVLPSDTTTVSRQLINDVSDALWRLHKFVGHADVILNTMNHFMENKDMWQVGRQIDLLHDLVGSAENFEADELSNQLNDLVFA